MIIRARIPLRLFGMARRLMAALVGCCLFVSAAHAEKIENQVAVFSALDKVTAQISKFEVKLGESAIFGALKVTPRACYSRSATEQPKTSTFVEVEEIQLDKSEKRVFTGWMFAESPGLYGVEHPTYDVWLSVCKDPPATAAAQPAAAKSDGGAANAGETDPAATQAPADDQPRRRVRR